MLCSQTDFMPTDAQPPTDRATSTVCVACRRSRFGNAIWKGIHCHEMNMSRRALLCALALAARTASAAPTAMKQEETLMTAGTCKDAPSSEGCGDYTAGSECCKTAHWGPDFPSEGPRTCPTGISSCYYCCMPRDPPAPRSPPAAPVPPSHPSPFAPPLLPVGWQCDPDEEGSCSDVGSDAVCRECKDRKSTACCYMDSSCDGCL